MEVLTLLALAWAWQTRASFGHGLVLVLAAPLIAFVLNGFRVVGLVVFPDSDVWSVPHHPGRRRLRARGAADRAPRSAADAREAPRRPPRRRLRRRPGRPAPPRALLAWLGAAALVSLAHPALRGPRASAPRASSCPPRRRAGRRRSVELDRLYLGSVRFDRAEARRYQAEVPPPGTSDGEPVRVTAFIGESDRRSRATGIQSPKNRVPGRGWLAEALGTRTCPAGMTAERVIATAEGRRALSYVWYKGLGSPWSEALRAFLALDQSPFRRERRAYVVRLYTDLLAGAPGRAQCPAAHPRGPASSSARASRGWIGPSRPWDPRGNRVGQDTPRPGVRLARRRPGPRLLRPAPLGATCTGVKATHADAGYWNSAADRPKKSVACTADSLPILRPVNTDQVGLRPRGGGVASLREVRN